MNNSIKTKHFQLIKHAVDKIHEHMVQEEQSKECHDTFQTIKLSLQPKSGYYSMMVFLFNPYSIALSVTKVQEPTESGYY